MNIIIDEKLECVAKPSVHGSVRCVEWIKTTKPAQIYQINRA